jgi:hypothetical protein
MVAGHAFVAVAYGCRPQRAQQAKEATLLDETDPIPAELRHERFVATPLTNATAAMDYATNRSAACT